MSPQANAAIPNSARIIPFQGVLTNSSGNYVADGNYDMVFSIYNVASAGTALWSTTHSGANAVPVTNGAFSVNIGSLDANGVNISMDTPPYYLGIKVGTNAEMTPRIQLGFSPFAMTSKLTDVGETSGQIAFFTTTCPSGWTEYTAARGLYIVGNPASGTLATAVGTALTNLENRPVGQHNHGIADSGHTHSIVMSNNSGGGLVVPEAWYNDSGSNNRTGYTSTATTGITISNSGSVAGTNAPYIQLTACQKS